MDLRLVLVTFAALVCFSEQAAAETPSDAVAALVTAYPDFIDRIEAGDLVWNDGTRMRIDDGRGVKSPDELLNQPDIKDMFLMTYPSGAKGAPPDVNFDPGRIRYLPLFTKMYGDCRTASANAKNVVWLPTKYGKTIRFDQVNGAADALQKVSDQLDQLSPDYLKYLLPLGGTYNCRTIAQTNRASPHSFGIAVDLAPSYSDYWLWFKSEASNPIAYKNRIPSEIVQIFENHGFIWGGKWYHYDTMHFEYRPEMLIGPK
jgi:hypothetical protein